ncbi:hypothetical protein F5Y15DRAFT_54592 [Xylariaceae sp. FL0016]|nr:hypothetical protein F5Y15DRAFT_54592 [Xylariaceae sp. FL0016]
MPFSNVAIIAAPSKDSETFPGHSSGVSPQFAPALQLAHRFQQLLHSAILSLVLRAYLITFEVLLQAGWYIQTSAIYGLSMILRFFLRQPWDSGAARRLRKKVEYEIFSFLFGFAHILCLMIFWPGWIFGLVAVIALICTR